MTAFAAFRRQFLAPAAWAGPGDPDQLEQAPRALVAEQGSVTGEALRAHLRQAGVHMDEQGPRQGHLHRPNLRTLDLKALPREEGPPSETQLRRQKFAFFDKHCSQVEHEGLYVSGDTVARDRVKLQEHGITHVLNCVGFVCKEYFKGELEYRTYYLQDTPAEDILCVLYDAFDYIEHALASGGRVLVHCSQGVSRSATIVLAYLMWKHGLSYERAFQSVKGSRGVANPNIGFTCQLLQWQKRRNSPPAATRMYRIAPHCTHAPLLLVPRMVVPPHKYHTHTWRQLDPRGSFIIQTPDVLYVWHGTQSPASVVAAAQRAAVQLLKYEGRQDQRIVECMQGSEPVELLRLMDPAPLDAEAQKRNARRASICGELDDLAMLCTDGPDASVPLLPPQALAQHQHQHAMSAQLTFGVSSQQHTMQGSPGTDIVQRSVHSLTIAGQQQAAHMATAPAPAGPCCRQDPAQQDSRPNSVQGGNSTCTAGTSAGTAGVSSTPADSTRRSFSFIGQPSTQVHDGWPHCQQQQQLHLASRASAGTHWCVVSVDEYSPEYQLYADAVRAAGGSAGTHHASLMGTPLPPGGRSVPARTSVCGNEQFTSTSSMGDSTGVNIARALSSFQSFQDAGQGRALAPVLTGPGPAAVAQHMQGKAAGYSEALGGDDMVIDQARHTGRRIGMFPSFHQSMDDEDM